MTQDFFDIWLKFWFSYHVKIASIEVVLKALVQTLFLLADNNSHASSFQENSLPQKKPQVRHNRIHSIELANLFHELCRRVYSVKWRH